MPTRRQRRAYYRLRRTRVVNDPAAPCSAGLQILGAGQRPEGVLSHRTARIRLSRMLHSVAQRGFRINRTIIVALVQNVIGNPVGVFRFFLHHVPGWRIAAAPLC